MQAHYLIMNIAAADLFVGCISDTTLMAGIISNLVLNKQTDMETLVDIWKVPCHVVGPLSTIFVYASYFTLCCIVLDRCLVVAYGAKYKVVVTRRVIKTEIILSWAISIILAFLGPQFFGLTEVIYSFHPPESMCVVVEKADRQTSLKGYQESPDYTMHRTIRDPRFSLMESILSLYLPCIILISSSITMLALLHNRKMIKKSRIVRRSCEIVVLMVVGYLFFATPYAITGLIRQKLTPDLYLVFRYILQLHCMFTPIIYVSRDPKFRGVVKVSIRRRARIPNNAIIDFEQGRRNKQRGKYQNFKDLVRKRVQDTFL